MCRTTSEHGKRLGAALALACALHVPAPAFAKGASVESATAEQSNAASDKYRAGTDAYESQHYDDALVLFRASYDVVASPNSHLMIARTLSKMGKHAEAYAEIESTIAEADAAASKSDKYKKTAQTARGEQSEMTKKVGFVAVSLPAKVTVGGEPLGPARLGRVAANPGESDVVLELPSGEKVSRQVTVAAGEETAVELSLPERERAPAAVALPAPSCPPLRTVTRHDGIDQRTLAYVAGGIGVAGMATFAVFGLLDNSKYDGVKSGCSGGTCPRSVSSDAETGRTYQTLANVGLGVGAVGLVTGAALFFTAPSRSRDSATATTTRVAIGPGRVALEGQF